MSTITTRDGTQIYYKDWGTGPVVTFSHGWPLSADAWEAFSRAAQILRDLAAKIKDEGLREGFLAESQVRRVLGHD